MINSVTRITLNLQETNTMVSVKAKRGDTSRKLLIHLSDGSIPYHISDECYATFTAKKPDGTKINNACTIENNVIHYEFTPQTCSAVGTMKAEIKLYGADDKMITSACFLISVYDTVYTEGDEVSSESEMNTLDDLILRANAFLNETGKLLRWQGEWDSEAEYEANDLVLHQEILYVAEDAAAAGTEPGSEGAAWVPIAGMGTGSGAGASDEQLYSAVSAYVKKNPLVEIKSVTQTQTSALSSGLNIFTIELSTGEKLDFHVHNGQMGPTGPRGLPGPSVMGPQGPAGNDGADGGHYVPSVSQPDANTLQFDFIPSQDDMPAVDPVQVELPVGQGSGENADLTPELKTALVNYYTHVMPNFDDANGLTYINAILTALGAEIREEPAEEDTHTHSYTSAVTTAATCTTNGVRTYTCSCGESYTEAIPATGHKYVDGVCSVCGAADPDYEEEVTLSSISATYSGGNVAVGTAVTALTGIVVTAHYSDGTSATVTGYTLSGEIAEGSNTVTVTYNGKTTTFTVTGVAEKVPVSAEGVSSINWFLKNGTYGTDQELPGWSDVGGTNPALFPVEPDNGYTVQFPVAKATGLAGCVEKSVFLCWPLIDGKTYSGKVVKTGSNGSFYNLFVVELYDMPVKGEIAVVDGKRIKDIMAFSNVPDAGFSFTYTAEGSKWLLMKAVTSNQITITAEVTA